MYQRARVHNVVITDCKLVVTALVWSLVLGFAMGNSRTIKKLRRTYIRFAAHHLCPSSFHDRLSEAFAALLRELIGEVGALTPIIHTIPGHLDRIRVVIIADATIFLVYELLADHYPATHEARVGGKLHLVHHITAGTIDCLDIGGERRSDSDPIQNGPSFRDDFC